MEDILQFFSDNKDALTAIGIILTFLASAISLYFSVRNNKAVHYVNAVTKSRIEWIQRLRDIVSDFISKTNVYNNVYYRGDYDKSGEHLSKCQQLCSEIKLLLNCCDKRDKKICELSDRILENHRKYCDRVHNMRVDEDGYFIENDNTVEIKKSIGVDIEKLVKELHIYLKAEWNRVKYESQGKTYEKIVQEFDLGELEEKYDNPGYKNKIWKRRFIVLWAKIKKLFPICIVVDFLSFIGEKFKRG